MNKNEESTIIAKKYVDELEALYEKYSPIVGRLKDSPQQKTAAYLKQLLLKKSNEYREVEKNELTKPESGKGSKNYHKALEALSNQRMYLVQLARTIWIWDDERAESKKIFMEEFCPMNKEANLEDVRKMDKTTYRKLSQLARLHNHFINVRNETTIWALEKDVSFIVMDGDANHINVNVFLNEIRSYKLDRATEKHTNTTYTPKKTMVFTLPKTNLIGAVLYYGIKIRNFWGGAECWERENHQAFFDLT